MYEPNADTAFKLQITNALSLSFSQINGSFTLAKSDSETDRDSMKFYCQWVSVTVNTSVQFRASRCLLGLGVGLGLGQCEHIVRILLYENVNNIATCQLNDYVNIFFIN